MTGGGAQALEEGGEQGGLGSSSAVDARRARARSQPDAAVARVLVLLAYRQQSTTWSRMTGEKRR